MPAAESMEGSGGIARNTNLQCTARTLRRIRRVPIASQHTGCRHFDGCASSTRDKSRMREFRPVRISCGAVAQYSTFPTASSTLCCPSSSPRQRQQCSGSGHSRPQRELTVSATFRSSRRQRDRDADDRSQGRADVARRMCVARRFPERQLNRCRGHWASKTNRMSAAHGAGLTHPTRSNRLRTTALGHLELLWSACAHA